MMPFMKSIIKWAEATFNQNEAHYDLLFGCDVHMIPIILVELETDKENIIDLLKK